MKIGAIYAIPSLFLISTRKFVGEVCHFYVAQSWSVSFVVFEESTAVYEVTQYSDGFYQIHERFYPDGAVVQAFDQLPVFAARFFKEFFVLYAHFNCCF